MDKMIGKIDLGMIFAAGMGLPTGRTANQRANAATGALLGAAAAQAVGQGRGRTTRFTIFRSMTAHCRKMTAAAMLGFTKGFPGIGTATGFVSTARSVVKPSCETENGAK